MNIIVKDRQTIPDIALMASGSMEAAMEIAIANGRSITDDLDDGEVLVVPSVKNERVAYRYSLKKIVPATAITDAEKSECPYEGIGYMTIGADFVVAGNPR